MNVQTFLANSSNADALRVLETCLFVVCLDERVQNWTDLERSHKSNFEQMLHGHGPFMNGANRWFDKTIQVSQVSSGQ